jgi:hypothetical protein
MSVFSNSFIRKIVSRFFSGSSARRKHRSRRLRLMIIFNLLRVADYFVVISPRKACRWELALATVGHVFALVAAGRRDRN